MKILKSYMIKGTIFVCIIGTLFHFVYNWSANNIIVGLFSPINESVWEHMKLIFFPMLIFSIYAKASLKTKYPCINSSMAFATLLGTFLVPLLFYTYSGILGFHLAIIDISIFYISVIIAFYIAYKTTIFCAKDSYKILLKIFLLVLLIAFFVFTFFPPDIALFVSP